MTFSLEWVVPLHPVGPKKHELSRLIGHVRIFGADFHVNAEQVEDVDGEEPRQTAVSPDGTYVDEIRDICEGEGETVSIDGLDYLLIISPFQR